MEPNQKLRNKTRSHTQEILDRGERPHPSTIVRLFTLTPKGHTLYLALSDAKKILREKK